MIDEKNETWKEIEGETGYLISNKGRVKSLNYRRTGKAQILKLSENMAYMMVNIRGKLYSVHRLVASAFVPNPENKTDVNHINCDTHDNRAENLEWVSRNENISKYFNSDKYYKIKTADRIYFMTKKESEVREYDLIVGSGTARHIENGKIRSVKELLNEGYVIRCKLILEE